MSELNRVMSVRTRNGVIYINVSTQTDMNATALSVLQHRLADGFYDCPPEPPKPEMTQSQIKRSLPVGEIRTFANNKLNDWKEEVNEYERRRRLHLTISECLEARDGTKALELLTSRQYEEGEQISIFSVRENY